MAPKILELTPNQLHFCSITSIPHMITNTFFLKYGMWNIRYKNFFRFYLASVHLINALNMSYKSYSSLCYWLRRTTNDFYFVKRSIPLNYYNSFYFLNKILSYLFLFASCNFIQFSDLKIHGRVHKTKSVQGNHEKTASCEIFLSYRGPWVICVIHA